MGDGSGYDADCQINLALKSDQLNLTFTKKANNVRKEHFYG